MFENDVNSYGTQTRPKRTNNDEQFENDVNSHGTRADLKVIFQSTKKMFLSESLK